VLSSARLLEIIKKNDLYMSYRDKTDDELVDKMRKDIRIEFAGEPERDRRPARDAVQRTVAFGVSYTATNPVVAMQVTNTLADLYVQENLKLREQQATGTSDFLEGQLGSMRKKLAEQEKRIAEYKEKHMGELPEQKEANLRTLERLQSALASAHETHRRAVERKQQITQSLAEIDQGTGDKGSTVMAAPTPVSATAARLNILRSELVQLQTKYSDKYPDVVYTKEQIRILEARLAEEQAVAALPKQEPKKTPSGLRVIPQNSYVQSLMSQLDQANVEAKTGAEQIAGLQRQIAMYERRIENAPRREHDLALITRDYETTRTVFQQVLGERQKAGIAVDLEHGQKGEKFRIMEGARMPERPTGPNRMRLLLIGFALAIGASGAAVVLAENVDTSFRRADEVRSRFPVPILSTIPRIITDRDVRRRARQRRLATAAVAVGLFVVVGGAFAVAHNNHELVGLLTPDVSATSTTARR
jgi:polysaccharide chain length determinant protein (PEP-CTERM system associated)